MSAVNISYLNTVINAVKNIPLPSGTQIKHGLQGFSAGFHSLFLADYADAMQRGASPNTTFLRGAQMDSLALAGSSLAKLIKTVGYLRTSWLITPFLFFLPLIINGWPRAGADNSAFEWLRDGLQAASEDLSTRAQFWKRMLSYPLYGLYWILNHLPIIENTYIIQFFDFLDKYLLPLALVILAGSYVGLYLLGNTVLPIVASLTLAFGLLDRMNVMPLFLRHLFNSIGLPMAFISGVLFGSVYEMAISAIVLPLVYGHLFGFKNILISVFNYFGGTEFAHHLTEQDRTTPTLDFRCHTSQFKHAIRDITRHRDSFVLRKHVRDNDNLLPPKATDADENLNDLITLFDEIEWNSANRKVMRDNRHKDWRIKRDEGTGLTHDRNLTKNQRRRQHVRYLRKNLETFIRRVRENDIHSIQVGGEDLIRRYTFALINQLSQLSEDAQNNQLSAEERLSKRNTLVDNLITLGFETGDYCGIALLRVTEDAYRSLMTNNRELTLKQSVRMIHQIPREQFFQRQYIRFHLNTVDAVDDTHAYTRAVELFAPRLGLPGQFAQYDVVAISPPILKDIASAASAIEGAFWNTPEHSSVETHERQLKNAMGTPLLSLETVNQWYQQFIEDHTFGTPAEKRRLKKKLPYTVNEIGHHVFYQLRPEIARLMLLDCGTIGLAATDDAPENFYRPDRLINEDFPAEPVADAATGWNIFGFQWGNAAPAAAPQAPANDARAHHRRRTR